MGIYDQSALCNHCYCQDGGEYKGVEHREYCKCGDKMATSITAPHLETRGLAQEVERIPVEVERHP